MIILYHGIPRKSRVLMKFFLKNKGQKRGIRCKLLYFYGINYM
nr:MAG TPA: hypothetical protein [Caudoviricetes sp.]